MVAASAYESFEKVNGEYHVQIDPDDGEPLSTGVIEAVAEVADDDAATSDVHLYDVIEFDALDSLYRHARKTGEAWELEFGVNRFDVVVRSDGHITIR